MRMERAQDDADGPDVDREGMALLVDHLGGDVIWRPTDRPNTGITRPKEIPTRIRDGYRLISLT